MTTPEPMDKDTLLGILRDEEHSASAYYESELAAIQTDAMERYFAEPYGDETTGRSQVISHDTEDVVNSIMPHLMRLLLTDDLLTVEDGVRGDIKIEKQAEEYLKHIMFKDNDGEGILHDFIFDGVLQRCGVVKISYEDPEPEVPQIYEGLSPEQVQQMQQDGEHKILEEEQGENDVFSIKVQKTPRMGKIVIEAIAPEEFGIATRSKSIEEARYHRIKQETYVADLKRQFPESADELDARDGTTAHDSIDDIDADPRNYVRHEEENYDYGEDGVKVEQRERVDLLTEWIRIDFDGDGIVELRQVKRVGNTILENLAVNRSELVMWSPIRVAHRAIGRSVADQVADLQKVRSQLMRHLLDGLSQSLLPRTFVNAQMLGPDESVLDQMLDRDIGDHILVQGDAREAVYESVTPDVSQSVYAALEYTDQRTEQASGIMRHAQGHRAEAITDTAAGIKTLQTAANARIELIGRWAIKGVEGLFQRVLLLVVEHQDQPRMIRVNGEPSQIDPRAWSEDMTVTVHVGIAAESREEKLSKLLTISQKQEQIILQAGMGNPLCGLKEYQNTLHDLTKTAGFRDPGRYFKEIPEGFQPPQQQQQDPKAMEAQAKIQLEQQKAQADVQLETQKIDFEQAAQAKKLQTDEAIEARKLENERVLQEARLQSEREIAEMRIASEAAIAQQRMEFEQMMAERSARLDEKVARSNVAIKARSANGQNRPGGRLDK